MITINTIDVWGFEGAIKGMRNPYESWDKSDSLPCSDCDCTDCSREYNCHANDWRNMYFIGKADMELAKKLIKAGSEHREFLCMIHVQADVVAPRYWWAEMDKYKYVEANSSSTMHLITKRYLRDDDFSCDGGMGVTYDGLNILIQKYKNTTDADMKELYFRTIKQRLPESYNQLRTIDTNYETLLNIYMQRENHKLIEWKYFCDWCLTLPYFSEFIGELKNE